jgi:hypothetical protein
MGPVLALTCSAVKASCRMNAVSADAGASNARWARTAAAHASSTSHVHSSWLCRSCSAASAGLAPRSAGVTACSSCSATVPLVVSAADKVSFAAAAACSASMRWHVTHRHSRGHGE